MAVFIYVLFRRVVLIESGYYLSFLQRYRRNLMRNVGFQTQSCLMRSPALPECRFASADVSHWVTPVIFSLW